MNHGKREESMIEESFLKDYCSKKQITYYVSHLENHQNHENFQEYARDKRYAFFEKIIQTESAEILLLAHHLNDDMETMLMRLFRGGNLNALKGMDQIIKNKGYYILRPLLACSKEAIKHYAQEHNIRYFEDDSNQSDAYTRNRIRHDIIPKLFLENPQWDKRFATLKETFHQASVLMAKKTQDIIDKLCTISCLNIHFFAPAFMEIDSFYQKEVLFELLKPHHLSESNIDEILKWIYSKRPNMVIDFKGFYFIKEYDTIIITEELRKPKLIEIVIDQLKDYPIGDDFIIRAAKKSNNSIANSHKMWYNSSMLPVVIRRRREGDVIKVQGGSKKIKKLFIDNKVPLTKRDEAILCVKDGVVLAVFGHAISDDIKNLEKSDIVIELITKEKENEDSSKR